MGRIKLVSVICGALMASCGAGLGGLGGYGGGSGGGAGGGGTLSSSCRGDFGAGASARKLEAFLLATSNFLGAAAEIEGSLGSTCLDMGSELGIPDAELRNGTPLARSACTAVSNKIRSELQSLRASAALRIAIHVDPPVCEVSIDAYGGCMAECEVDFDPGAVTLQCEGGEIRGTCSAQCTGRCAVDVQGQCSGVCEGTCSAGCTGTCRGRCDGTCSAQGADGQCNGTCQGQCEGTCSAGCQGSCRGQCVVEARATCSGECRGGCSVEWQQPRCTGTVRPPSASAECRASCDARLDAQAECRPGRITVAIQGEIGADVQERTTRLRRALESGLPAIQALAAQLQRLTRSGQAMVRTSQSIPGAIGSLGLSAAACASEAAAAIPRAVGSISVSVEVSVSVSASAG